jgi:gluconolactonase
MSAFRHLSAISLSSIRVKERGRIMTRMGRLTRARAKAVLFICLAVPVAAAGQQPEIATTVAFTEGPTVDRDGNVYFTDIINQRIMKLSAAGALSTYREHSNVANGLLIDPQGRLIACEGSAFERPGVKLAGTPRVTRTDLKTGKIEVLADRYEGKPLVGPNDVTIDGQGRLYFTELNGAAVYRIDAPGKLARILAAPEIERPNGIQISPDDRTLYLVEANPGQGGARLIRAYDLQPDGTVRNMRVLYDFSPGRSADGMSIDTQGNLYASAGLNQLRGTSETLDTRAGVYVISPQGTLLTFIPITEDLITNNAFGGPDMKTLYVTAGKNLYSVRTAIAGLPR